MPSPLASIYSAADSFKRGLLDAVQNPVDKMRQVVGNANDRAGVLNALTSEAAQEGSNGGSLFGPKSQELSGLMADAYNPMGLTVFHGSPYKFNAFAPKAIGSGEGAQAYGYGHYVAGDIDVAKGYSPRDAGYEDALMKMYNEFERKGDWNSLAVVEDALLHKTPSELRSSFGPSSEGLIKKIEAVPQESSLYKIDLPDEQIDKMLDWDAEISKQTSEVQALAKQFGLASDDLGGDLVAAMNAKLPEGAESMRSAGVPGIKYFDAQSRGGKKADTRNFVVFPGNEGLLKILERNSVPLE